MLSRETLEDTLQRIPQIDPESDEYHSVSVAAVNDDGEIEKFDVVKHTLKRLDWFREKNRKLSHLHLSYVTSEIKSE